MWSHYLPTELYDYVISFIQPDYNLKLKYDFCLIFINGTSGKSNMKRCTPCQMCHKMYTYNRLCRSCDQLRWFEMT